MPILNEELYADIMASSNVVHGDKYHELVYAISKVASDMVVKTLGPYGRTTVIDEGTGFTYPSKDGWTCLNKLQFTDPTYNTIYQMLKKISFNSVTTVGDGTTTAMVAANNFLRMMYEYFIPEMEKKGGFRQANFIDSMEEIYGALEEQLRNNPAIRQIDLNGDFSDIYDIAYIATNGNHKFASLIQEIYQKTKNPHIQIELSPTAAETEISIQTGYKFDAHAMNFHAYVNDQSGNVVLTNTPRLVIIFDHSVTYQLHKDIITAISKWIVRDPDNVQEIIIMAPYFDDIISTWMTNAVNRSLQGNHIPNIMLMQIPMATQMHRKTLSDLCAITGATIFDEPRVKAFNILLHNATHEESERLDDPIFDLDDYKYEHPQQIIEDCMGNIRSIIIDKNEAFIQDYETFMNEKMFQMVVQEATEDFEARRKKALKTIGGTLDKEYMFSQLRYIKLTGNTGVIRIGAVSDIQQRTDKDTIDDAVLACKSAFENGYVRGMNLELLTMLKNPEMRGLPYEHEIYNMLYACFYETSLQVIRNKHPFDDETRLVKANEYTKDPERGTETILPTKEMMSSRMILDKCIDSSEHYDYNLRSEVLSRKDHWTVVNSAATDIEILRAVVNVLTTIITSDQYISVTQRFDAQRTDEKNLSLRMHEDYRLTANKVNAFMNTLAQNENYDLLQAVIGGIHMDDPFAGLALMGNDMPEERNSEYGWTLEDMDTNHDGTVSPEEVAEFLEQHSGAHEEE